jgi:hypothetical protein
MNLKTMSKREDPIHLKSARDLQESYQSLRQTLDFDRLGQNY